MGSDGSLVWPPATPMPADATHVLDEGLHDLVAVGHVCHHVSHVVLGRPHQCGAEHQGQVSGLHLQPELGLEPAQGHPSAFAAPSGTISLPTPPRAAAQPTLGELKVGQGSGRDGAGVRESPRCLGPMPRVGGWYLVLLRVVSDGLQVTHQELERLVVMTWQVPDLRGCTRSPLRSPPPPFPPTPAPQGGLQGCAPQPLPISLPASAASSSSRWRPLSGWPR